MSLLRYSGRRIVQAVPVLLGVVAIAYTVGLSALGGYLGSYLVGEV